MLPKKFVAQVLGMLAQPELDAGARGADQKRASFLQTNSSKPNILQLKRPNKQKQTNNCKSKIYNIVDRSKSPFDYGTEHLLPQLPHQHEVLPAAQHQLLGARKAVTPPACAHVLAADHELEKLCGVMR